MAAIDVRTLLAEVGELLQMKLGEKFIEQGHNLTGKLVRSIEYKVRPLAKEIVLEVIGERYGIALDTGVPSHRIPYSPARRSGARESLYILALIRYVRRRRLASKREDQKSIAFAIARTHAREGMPTKRSSRFSRTGKRTGAFAEVQKENESAIIKLFERKFADGLETLIFDAQRA